MSHPARSANSSPAIQIEAIAALSRLARKGAYATPVEGGSGAADGYAVFSPRNGFAEPIAVVPAGALLYALQQDWLERRHNSEQLFLTDLGARVLRRARSSSGLRPSSARGKTADPGDANRRARSAGRAATGGGPLAWLRRRKDKHGRPLVSETQLAAGERLASDYWRAQFLPRVTADWSAAAPVRRVRRAAPGAGVDLSDGLVAARARVHKALAAVGPELSGILVHVCCLDMGLESAGRAEGWPERAAKVVLQLALTSLARHYGLIAPEPPLSGRLRHWGEDDYRPTLEAWR